MMRSSGYNRFGVLMGTSWRASGPRSHRLQGDFSPMITLILLQRAFCATAIKHKQQGRLVEVEQRILRGTEEEILAIIRSEHRGQTINTSYVESRNGNYRKDNKRLTRRSACHSKKVALHDAQIDLLTGIYNFVDENMAFRQCIHPNAKRFEVKYKKYSPAMLEGFTDRCLTLEELLMWRVPK